MTNGDLKFWDSKVRRRIIAMKKVGKETQFAQRLENSFVNAQTAVVKIVLNSYSLFKSMKIY
jgi:hypothetical protein